MYALHDCAAMVAGAQTGDIVLFSGKGPASAVIRWLTRSRWTHVAVVVRLPGYDFPCLWEATRDTDVDDLDCGPPAPGVQLVPLHERLRAYQGEVALRQLLDTTIGTVEQRALATLRTALVSRPYRFTTRDLLATGYAFITRRLFRRLRAVSAGGVCTHAIVTSAGRTLHWAPERQHLGLFCSELVAVAYQAAGLISPDRGERPAHRYAPADFSQDSEFLPWRRGRLGPEILLKQAIAATPASEPRALAIAATS